MIGVSPDSVKSHAKFKLKHGFAYPLIADVEHTVCELYGVWAEKSMYGKQYWGVNPLMRALKVFVLPVA